MNATLIHSLPLPTELCRIVLDFARPTYEIVVILNFSCCDVVQYPSVHTFAHDRPISTVVHGHRAYIVGTLLDERRVYNFAYALTRSGRDVNAKTLPSKIARLLTES